MDELMVRFDELHVSGIFCGRGPDLEMPRSVERVWAERGGDAVEVVGSVGLVSLFRVIWRVGGGVWVSMANPSQADVMRVLRDVFGGAGACGAGTSPARTIDAEVCNE